MDKEKIKLVIQNFIDNALKYSTEGGKIIIKMINDGNNVGVEVKDSGLGIPLGQQDKIFMEFFRGSNAVKSQASGSGLGLFLSKNIIDAHDGRIWFESEENKGSIFYFTVPIRDN